MINEGENKFMKLVLLIACEFPLRPHHWRLAKKDPLSFYLILLYVSCHTSKHFDVLSLCFELLALFLLASMLGYPLFLCTIRVSFTEKVQIIKKTNYESAGSFTLLRYPLQKRCK